MQARQWWLSSLWVNERPALSPKKTRVGAASSGRFLLSVRGGAEAKRRGKWICRVCAFQKMRKLYESLDFHVLQQAYRLVLRQVLATLK